MTHRNDVIRYAIHLKFGRLPVQVVFKMGVALVAYPAEMKE